MSVVLTPSFSQPNTFLYSPTSDRPIFMVLHYFDCVTSSVFLTVQVNSVGNQS